MEEHVFLINRINNAGDESVEVLFVIEEIELVGVDDQGFAQVITLVPVIVVVVQTCEVFDRDLLLVVSSSLFDPLLELRNRTAKEDHKSRRAEVFDHRLEQLTVVGVVSFVELPLLIERSCEDVRIFVDGTVLDRAGWRFFDLFMSIESVIKEIDLEWEGPAAHVFIEVSEVRIVLNRFEVGLPAKSIGEFLRESCFSASDVPCDNDEHRTRLTL